MIMSKLIIIIGLPGSGKSNYMQELLISEKIEERYIYDDFHAKAEKDSPEVIASRHFTSLSESLKMGKTCMVSDIAFCNNERRKAFMSAMTEQCKNVKMELHCFRNEPGQCKENIKMRARKSADREMELVDELTDKYQIPTEAKQIPVCQNSSTANE